MRPSKSSPTTVAISEIDTSSVRQTHSNLDGQISSKDSIKVSKNPNPLKEPSKDATKLDSQQPKPEENSKISTANDSKSGTSLTRKSSKSESQPLPKDSKMSQSYGAVFEEEEGEATFSEEEEEEARQRSLYQIDNLLKMMKKDNSPSTSNQPTQTPSNNWKLYGIISSIYLSQLFNEKMEYL